MSSDRSNHSITRPAVPAGVTLKDFRTCVEAAYGAWITNRQSHEPVTPAEIQVHSGMTRGQVNKIVSTPEFTAAIENRGVPWGGVKETNPLTRGLTDKQIHVLSIVLNPTDKRPFGDRLKKAGTTYGVYRAWMKSPVFSAAARSMGEAMIQDHISDVHTALTNKASGGDIAAMKLYYEVSGRFDPAARQISDLKGMVNLLLEVITTHVKDPSVLTAISEDMTDRIGNTIKGEIL